MYKYHELLEINKALRISKDNYKKILNSFPNDEVTLNKIEVIDELLNGEFKRNLFDEEEVDYISELLEVKFDKEVDKIWLDLFQNKLKTGQPFSDFEKFILLDITKEELKEINQNEKDGKYKVGYGNYISDVFVISEIIEKINLG